VKEKIEQLAHGVMTYELPAIKLSEEKISLKLTVGKRHSESVTISNDANIHMKGLVYSTNPRVIPETTQFIGCENIIEFTVNTEYAEVSDHILGELCFVTNCGEMTLPFDIEITSPIIKTINGRIYNMHQFAALARSNWEEARRLFTAPEFESFLRYNEPQSIFLWERLLKSPLVDNAMEQFLIATRKKLPVKLIISKNELRYDVGQSSFADGIKISRSNWGYVNYSVSCDSDFIEIEQESITSEDFDANEFEFKFIIHPENMHIGINCGTITITGCGQQLVIPVTCHAGNPEKARLSHKIKTNKLLIKALENHISYVMNQIPEARYIAEANALMDEYDKIPGADLLLTRLYRAKLLRLVGKESPALSVLNNISDEELDEASVYAKAMFTYLRIEKMETPSPELLEDLYELCQLHPEKPQLQLLVLKVDERYKKNIRARLDELHILFDKGCHSALLLTEASMILNQEPLLLKETGTFDTTVMLFSLKRNNCSRDLASQFTSLVLRQKAYVKVNYNILALIYEKYQLKDTLTAICQTLIRGYRKESRYFKWYQKGAEENIRISDLYEYYMYSIDRQPEEELDQAVLMYYVYNSKLNDRRLAYLYANIVLHKDSNPIVYENYKEKLRIFTIQQMRTGKNDINLAVLYNDSLSDPNYAKQFSEHLSKVIFRYDVNCSNPNMKYICVAHKELDDEVIVPLIGGKAQIDIFTSDALIFMLDALNNRYVLSDDVELIPLMSGDGFAPKAYKYDRDNSMLIVNLAAKAHQMRRFDQIGLELRKQAAALSGISESSRESYISELVLYYYDHAQEEVAEDDLKKLNYKMLGTVRRSKFISLLVLREHYDLAFEIMKTCGFEGVETKILEKFATSLSTKELTKYDRTLCNIMYALFLNGRRHERIIIYLVNYFGGLTQSMYAIWQEACLAQCATADFDERILGQILFTESYLPYAENIYVHYYRRQKNRNLTKAYFNYLSYKYLISDIPISANIMEILKRDSYYETNDMVMLACLKQFAMADELSQEEQELAKKWLEIVDSKGKVLPCFRRLSRYFRLPENMDDKVYIEYRTNPEHRVTIHIASRQDGKRVVREETMRNVCYGIFIKEIILFAQESIEYVISEDDAEKVISTEKHTLTGPSDEPVNDKSRFASINAIIKARNELDRGKAIGLLNDYVKKEFAISQLFHEI
jgi:hypothetical protein